MVRGSLTPAVRDGGRLLVVVPDELGELARSIAGGTRWFAVAGLGLCAVLAGPQTSFGRIAGVTIVPLFAVLVVGAWAVRPSAERPAPDPGGEARLWSILVCSWFALTPALAIVRVAVGDAPTVVVDIVGLLLAAAITVPLALVARELSADPVARERRRVLGPPGAVLLLVILGSATGAFHWESPKPRADWPRAAVEVDPLRPWPTRPAP